MARPGDTYPAAGGPSVKALAAPQVRNSPPQSDIPTALQHCARGAAAGVAKVEAKDPRIVCRLWFCFAFLRWRIAEAGWPNHSAYTVVWWARAEAWCAFASQLTRLSLGGT